MTLRKALKRWLYGSCPGFAGSFPYFGSRVFFPKGSLSFYLACEQGIFEADNVRLLQALVRRGSWFFDVGTNIGLMSVPILRFVPDTKVLSFEPSPNVLPSLQRTIAGSPYRTRWNLVAKAVGDSVGRSHFAVSEQKNSLFDGLKATQRVPLARQVEVEMTTLDTEWKKFGSPEVSAIKCDVEGGELGVLRGARECLQSERPTIVLEWNAQNLVAYGFASGALIEFARELGFQVLALPHLIEVRTDRELRLQMFRTESFLLSPV